NSRIQKWLLGASSGTTLTSYNELSSPNSIFVDTTSTKSQIVAGTGRSGNQTDQLSSPLGIKFDLRNLNLYVADYGNNRIEKFQFYTQSCAWYPDATTVASGGRVKGQLSNPMDIAINSQQNLIVPDYGNQRLEKYFLINNTIVTLATNVDKFDNNIDKLNGKLLCRTTE
ncbi:unnamed protein product, partial [Didymodactylos carnosus]